MKWGCVSPMVKVSDHGCHVMSSSPASIKTRHAALIVLVGGVGTSGSERCHLHEDQTQDSLDRPVVAKTATSFNLSSDDIRVRMRRPRDERLNHAFVLQRYIASTAGVNVMGYHCLQYTITPSIDP
ncbi:hypothetical protein TNCV_3197441 [Trichonephila clavipes]|nr:hypothetical protein TNCV_3197441 [Trichonephila clavipes]